MSGGFDTGYSIGFDSTSSAGAGGSWERLRDIAYEAAEERRAEQSQPPEACPFGGTPLREHEGVRYCPDGDYQWPRDGRLI